MLMRSVTALRDASNKLLQPKSSDCELFESWPEWYNHWDLDDFRALLFVFGLNERIFQPTWQITRNSGPTLPDCYCSLMFFSDNNTIACIDNKLYKWKQRNSSSFLGTTIKQLPEVSYVRRKITKKCTARVSNPRRARLSFAARGHAVRYTLIVVIPLAAREQAHSNGRGPVAIESPETHVLQDTLTRILLCSVPCDKILYKKFY
jgi:hypothetical protein